MGQCRLNRSLASCPELILANDNLVGGGAIVTGLLLATTGALATDGCLDANCFFLAIVFVPFDASSGRSRKLLMRTFALETAGHPELNWPRGLAPELSLEGLCR